MQAALRGEIMALGVRALTLMSAAEDRATFLKRPDLGRRLGSHHSDRRQAHQ